MSSRAQKVHLSSPLALMTVMTWMTENPHKYIMAALLRPQFMRERGLESTLKPAGAPGVNFRLFFFLFLTWLKDNKPQRAQIEMHTIESLCK